MINTQDTTAPIRRELRTFIEETFLYLHPGLEVSDNDRLLELGVIDSLGFVELVEEVQHRFGIEVQDVEITEENFASIAAMAAFVERRRAV
jgi:acyl carrier protein